MFVLHIFMNCLFGMSIFEGLLTSTWKLVPSRLSSYYKIKNNITVKEIRFNQSNKAKWLIQSSLKPVVEFSGKIESEECRTSVSVENSWRTLWQLPLTKLCHLGRFLMFLRKSWSLGIKYVFIKNSTMTQPLISIFKKRLS